MATPAAPRSFWQPSRRVEAIVDPHSIHQRRNPYDQSEESNMTYRGPYESAEERVSSAGSGLAGALRGLGTEAVDLIKQTGETGNDIWKTIFGGETLADKRVAAGAYAAQAQANEQLAAERAQGWSKTLPWLIIGGTVLGSMVIWAAVKK